VQEPHYAARLQHQWPHQRDGHPCAHAHVAVLEGEVMSDSGIITTSVTIN
jgi:hypothetical protein